MTDENEPHRKYIRELGALVLTSYTVALGAGRLLEQAGDDQAEPAEDPSLLESELGELGEAMRLVEQYSARLLQLLAPELEEWGGPLEPADTTAALSRVTAEASIALRERGVGIPTVRPSS
jgi:hypothetical protein